jgi:hypothetical protein
MSIKINRDSFGVLARGCILQQNFTDVLGEHEMFLFRVEE